MIKSILGYLVLILCIALYIASSSENVMKRIADFKYHSPSALGSDKYRYGGLYGLCYLPEYKIATGAKPEIKKVKMDLPKAIDLYALCDSYLWSYVTTADMFEGVNKYQYARSNHEFRDHLNVKLDNSKLNILVIEMSERNVRFLLKDMKFMRSFIQTQYNNDPKSAATIGKIPSRGLLGTIFNQDVNTNLEFNIWDTQIFTPIKELKAEMNYKLFGRYSKEVDISEDKKFLLLASTTDTTTVYSAFQHINDNEIEEVVEKLNALYDLYKSRGFEKVYFSAIPNPVSVLYPNFKGYTYNELVKRIYSSPDLRMPLIDVNESFKNSEYLLFHPSDSHWNKNGVNLWLNTIDAVFKKDIEEQAVK